MIDFFCNCFVTRDSNSAASSGSGTSSSLDDHILSAPTTRAAVNGAKMSSGSSGTTGGEPTAKVLDY